MGECYGPWGFTTGDTRSLDNSSHGPALGATGATR